MTVHIPRIIVQFWDKPELPGDLRGLVDSWHRQPGVAHKLYNDGEARSYILEHFGAAMLGRYDICAIPAMKSDIFRICRIYAEGGIYIDCSIRRLGDIGDWVDFSVPCFVYRRWNGNINNGLFGAPPHSPYMAFLLDRISTNIDKRVSNNIHTVTGPFNWNKMISAPGLDTAKIKIVEHKDIANKHVAFAQNLKHKKDGTHWSVLQKSRSLFLGEEP